tara:strand:- start:82 stop:402 length:321 start_codon:yes stop_codon:yes gene_type:complete
MKLAIKSLMDVVSIVMEHDEDVDIEEALHDELLVSGEHGQPSLAAWMLVRKHQCDLSLHGSKWSVRAWAEGDDGKGYHGIAKDENVNKAVANAVHKAIEASGAPSS